MKGDLVTRVLGVINIAKKPVRVTIALLLLGSLVAAGNRSEWLAYSVIACFTALTIAFIDWLEMLSNYQQLNELVERIDQNLFGFLEFTLGFSYPCMTWVVVVVLTYPITGLYWLWAPLVAFVVGAIVSLFSLLSGINLEQPSETWV